ncbi:Cof-type HAD-IIB family hydrolase [Macrococcus lamae]|uniref:HAD family phosphatase n=1 Tax=Macrococcus lamae TaxID=198484 RepID=A0A4R6BVU8_9STAP|nr:Cof-type HAD-IIB family hydrolase [Macrococcus lamae]TDM12505.1 HAD family phosphatase [Macrococcus lamae]
MKEKHLICLDLDGTLLTDDKVISPYTKQVIQSLIKDGHKVIISTGRPYRASQIYYQELGLTTPIVNFNGAFVHHPGDMTFKTVHETLDLEIAREIFSHVKNLKIKNIIAEVKDNVFFHYHDEYLFEGFTMGHPLVTTGDLMENLTEGPTSILIQAEEANVPAIRHHLSEVYAESIEHRRWGAPYPVIEIVKKGINKSVGVDYVANHFDIKRENIIAFGDEDNDNEMIKFAGLGLAMGNAIQPLKEIADIVIESNNDDGIGKFLNQYFY